MLAENPRDSDMWVEAFEAKFERKGNFERKDWDQLLGHCMVRYCVSSSSWVEVSVGDLTTVIKQAITDTPCNVFAEELLVAYPEAKVILSVRDNVDVWYASYLNALQPFWDWLYLEPGWTGAIRRNMVARPRDDAMAWKLLQHTYYRDFPNLGKQHYLDHNAKIRSLAEEQDREFLEFNVKQGWKPLCEFLGVSVPDSPFPFGNDTKEMQAIVRGLKDGYDEKVRTKALKILGFASIAVAGFGLWYARRL